MDVKRALGTVATVICCAALVFVAGTIIVPGLFGLQRYVITGGSMTGTILKGAVIYSKITPVDQLKVGDIITFQPPGYGEAVTHRIVTIGVDHSGRRTFSTKGDFNKVADPWNPVVLNEPRQARYVFQIPLYGYLLAALTMRTARLALIAVPAVLIAVSLLWSLWRQAGEDLAMQDGEDALPRDSVGRA
jgi:signal peptidase